MYRNTYICTHFLTLKICVHTSIRSRHIKSGEGILLLVCGLFLCFPSSGFPPPRAHTEPQVYS